MMGGARPIAAAAGRGAVHAPARHEEGMPGPRKILLAVVRARSLPARDELQNSAHPQGSRVSGKMRFHGLHRKQLFGVPPSGRQVWWTGMPIFTFGGAKVRDLFVLGGSHGLIGRLTGGAHACNRHCGSQPRLASHRQESANCWRCVSPRKTLQ